MHVGSRVDFRNALARETAVDERETHPTFKEAEGRVCASVCVCDSIYNSHLSALKAQRGWNAIVQPPIQAASGLITLGDRTLAVPGVRACKVVLKGSQFFSSSINVLGILCFITVQLIPLFHVQFRVWGPWVGALFPQA